MPASSRLRHRLTTLQKHEARGIPFFFVRMDSAGNVSKRFSAGRFHFSKFGGACPLWNIHDCFATPDQVRTQIIQMPDNTTYFSIARTMSRSEGAFDRPPTKYAIGLGCDIAYAPRLIYAQTMKLESVPATPIGVNCYMCDRQNCPSPSARPSRQETCLRCPLAGRFRFPLRGQLGLSAQDGKNRAKSCKGVVPFSRLTSLIFRDVDHAPVRQAIRDTGLDPFRPLRFRHCFRNGSTLRLA